MRALLLALPLSILTLFPVSGNAGDARPLQIATVSASENVQSTNPNNEIYRGYYLDLSQIAMRKDFATMVDGLRHQLDDVERVKLSPRVFNFFHTVPIVVDDMACLNTKGANGEADGRVDDKAPVLATACYGPVSLPERTSREPTILVGGKWTNPDPVDLAKDTNRGVVFVRPIMLETSSNAQRPILLHEMFHAYHAAIMPRGVKNPAILFYYEQAKSKQLYPADAYLMTNEREFFAVTASVFLSGKADGGTTPLDIKQKQPDYFNYLHWLLVDPDREPSTSPLASAD